MHTTGSNSNNRKNYTYEQYINIDGGVITMITLACPTELYPQNSNVFSGIVSNFIYK
jgi:hypothetical protein